MICFYFKKFFFLVSVSALDLFISSLQLGLSLSSLVRRRHCFLLGNCWSISSPADCFPSPCLWLEEMRQQKRGWWQLFRGVLIQPLYLLSSFTEVQTTCDGHNKCQKSCFSRGGKLWSLVDFSEQDVKWCLKTRQSRNFNVKLSKRKVIFSYFVLSFLSFCDSVVVVPVTPWVTVTVQPARWSHSCTCRGLRCHIHVGKIRQCLCRLLDEYISFWDSCLCCI